jgi:hypothetical protein
LIGVEDTVYAATPQSLQAELHVKAVGELPAEHAPGEQIHNSHQVLEALPQWDADDACRPDLIGSCDGPGINQAGKAF